MSYPSDWDQRRKQVYRRDGFECQRCGTTDAELHAHHVRPVSNGGSHSLDNLTTLCKSCHEQHHGHRIPTGDSGPSLLAGWLLISAVLFTFGGIAVGSLLMFGIAFVLWTLGLALWDGW